MFKRTLAIATGSLVVGTPLAAAPAAPQIQDLGSLPGVTSSWAAINSDGTVATGTALSPTSGSSAAWVWDEELGYRLLDGSGTFQTLALDISADGTAVLGQFSTIPAGPRSIALWSVSTGQRFDFQAGPSLSLTPAGISADGKTVAGTSQNVAGIRRAFAWTSLGGATSLGLLGGADSVARSISEDGSVVVGEARTAAGIQTAVQWELGGAVAVIPGLPSTATFSSATHVSKSGLYVAGVVHDTSTPSGIFFYDGITGLTQFGLAAGIDSTVQLRGLSADGSTLLLERGTHDTLVWQPGTATLVRVPDGGRFQAGAINESGGVVVGTYSHPSSGQKSAARWEPSTGLELQPGLAGDSEAYRVSDDGDTLFGEADAGAGLVRPMIWRRSGDLGASVCAPATLNSTGQLGKLVATGRNSLDTPGLILSATQLPPAATSFVLASRTTTAPMAVNGSVGRLCLGGKVGRLLGLGQLQVTDAAGTFSLEIDPNVLPSPATGTTSATFGEAWTFQAWHRDFLVGPLTTSNFTNAVTIRFY